MKFGGGLLTRVNEGLLTAWKAHAGYKHTNLFPIFLTVLLGAAGLFLFSLLLPDNLTQVVQVFIGWCMAGSVAALALLATVKVLEDLLDS
ncbi:MAG: hypothetical protein JJD98_14030 [Polaromonas sp.]|nr:hypothetical protein [Polaromonas sp.]